MCRGKGRRKGKEGVMKKEGEVKKSEGEGKDLGEGKEGVERGSIERGQEKGKEVYWVVVCRRESG